MRRVVITGVGITSCLGNSLVEVTDALRAGRSGIRYDAEYAAHGMRSVVSGKPDISTLPPVPRKLRRFMGDASLYAYHAARQAIETSGLTSAQLTSERTGLVTGSGVGSPFEHHLATQLLEQHGLHKVLPYVVPRVMGSTVSANLATAFGIQGLSCGMTSACATSAHCIGYGSQLIQFGKQDVMIVGGAEEANWTSAAMFDAMGALTTHFPDETASRPYDESRDGFVFAGGAGMLVLESLEHAQARGAHIYAELTGFGASSDGLADMVMPSPEGAARAMKLALAEHQADRPEAAAVDYINAHATSTPVGDVSELEAIKQVFESRIPMISSTKGLSGHPIGASAAHELIYVIAMMQDGFVAGCPHLYKLDAKAARLPIVEHNMDYSIECAMSNSFGFGGTNVSIILQRYHA
ncbi:MAG: beta-ketoacyl synthase N-terminal-like domain-containing protein [Methylophilus sp.]|uniref:beta-ketoacyl synthase N-terminal-like domain-containing protein n=1 Tax=Methylophilus sp. TaxID=29541 RepID=UPI003FA018EC